MVIINFIKIKYFGKKYYLIKMKNVEIILFLLVSLVFSAQPPKIKKMNQITPNQPTIMKNKKTHLGLIRKRFLASTTTIENSKLTVNFEDNS